MHANINTLSRSIYHQLFCVVFTIAFILPVTASNLKIAPIRIEMQPQDKITLLTLSNQGTKEVNLQITPYQWEQANGQEKLSKTDDLIIIPPLLTLKGGQQSIIRIARRHHKVPTEEYTYRLILEEIQSLNNQENHPNSGLRLQMNFSLPLFIYPNTVRKEYLWQLKPLTKLSKQVTFTNNSNVHALITEIIISDKHNQKVIKSHKTMSYVLPQQQRTWDIEVDTAYQAETLSVSGIIHFPPSAMQ